MHGPLDREIATICYDSRQATAQSLFVATRGEAVDGHQFIPTAIQNGAVAVIGEMVFADLKPELQAKITYIQVPDARMALGQVANIFYKRPSLKLKVAGVTGTNGKTTTTYLIKHLCDSHELPCGLIGTTGYMIGGQQQTADRTTPLSADLHSYLAQMRAAKDKAVAMEVSSHALTLKRIEGVEFDVAVWTNLTQDHLDFHKTLAAYYEAKASWFLDFLPKQKRKRAVAILNIDDRYGNQLYQQLPKDESVITYGVSANADFRASNLRSDLSGSTYHLDALERTFLVRTPLIGRFNVYNTLAALAAAHVLKIPLSDAVRSLANAPSVPGRLEPVPAKRHFQVYVDYAHTPDALANVLKTLRDLQPHRLIVVYGCGGNRDRSKRSVMGRVVEELGDYAIITSDNPRKEDPRSIITEIEAGLQKTKPYEVCVDRREAIERAISLATARDIILIAGKGHETYQELANETIDFDDIRVAQNALQKHPVELSR